MSDWSQPPELHRHRAYEAADVEALVERITTRITELERQVAEMREAGDAEGAGGAGLDAQLGRALLLAHHAAAAVAHQRAGDRPAPAEPRGPEQKSDDAFRRLPPGEVERQAQARLAEVERQAQARLAEVERQAQARLAEAERQAQAVVEEARNEARALVEGVRRSLEDAVRLKDEEVVAALGESHERVLAMLDAKLRKGNGQPHEPPYPRRYP